MDASRPRVLLTRPEPGLSRTSAALRARGFEPVHLPLSRIVPKPAAIASLPCDDIAGYVVTSAAAIGAAEAKIDRSRPLFAVGSATAGAAIEIGCRDIRQGPGEAAGLADLVVDAASRLPKGRLLYLAGTPRKPDVERKLTEAGIEFETVIVYEAQPRPPSRAELIAANDAGLIAALFYSQASAERFCAAVEHHGLETDFAGVTMAGLSRQVVQPFNDRRWATGPVVSAPDLEEASLLRLLEEIRNKAG